MKNLGSGDDIYVGDEGAPDYADLVNGGAGADDLSGGLDTDILNGQADDDLLNGGAGDDILDGGDGDDTAVFSGAAGDYTWSGDNVSATITGPDGTDALYNVEHLRFGASIIDLPAPNVAPSAPTDGDVAANTVSEDVVDGAAVAGLTFGAVDPDASQTLTWSLLDDADGRFAIDAASGVVTVADASKLNFEDASSHQITVQVSDGTAVSSTTFAIEVTNVAPGAPVDFDAAANTVSEDAVNGAVVAGLVIGAADPNGGAVTYSLIDDAGGRFAIDAATGVVTVANASLLDYDVAAAHQITVRASDGTASSATDTSFTVDLVDAAPTTPTDADATVNAVSEGAANGDLVGITASATEPRTGSVTYSLADDAGGRFAINGATGVVIVADATKLNFESAASHQITVLATDAQGAASSQVFTIAVTNVANDAPVDGDATANTISEGTVNGEVVAGLSLSASDVHGGPLVYSLLGNAGGRFAINAVTGVVTVANANLLNYEAATSHQIIVQAASGTESASTAFTIDVTNAAPAIPTDTNGGLTRVSEHATTGTVVGGLTVAAPDPHGGTVTYSLTNDAGGRFAINATTGVVTVANASLLDADTQATHAITVQASDGSLASAGNIVINLIDEIDSYWTGTDGNDGFTVPDAQDWQLTGGWGNDTLVGGVGDDILIGGGGNDNLYGGAGNDTFLIGADAASDLFDGGAGTDTLKFTSNNVIISARAFDGMEVVNSNGFTNVGFRGTDRNDNWDWSGIANTGTMSAYLGAGHDSILGTSGNDILYGEAGNDSLYGLDGDDIFVGGEGDDGLFGGNGNDLFLADSGQDGYDGGAGYDEIRAVGRDSMIAIASVANVEKISSGGFDSVSIGLQHLLAYANWDFTNVELQGIAWISGGNQADTIIGSQGADVIVGNGGPDTLSGGLGDDIFVSGPAATLLRFDTVDGGAGWDKLLASSNNATFEIASMAGIEAISTNGFANVSFIASADANTLDLRNIVVTGSLSLVHLNAGDDTFYGTEGVDIVDGGTGNDYIDTGDGNDIIRVSNTQGLDVVHGGNGYDTVVAADSNVWIIFNTLDGIEAIQGNAFSRIIGADMSADKSDVIDLRNIVVTGVGMIDAGLGDDLVYGSAGADNVVSNGGNDVIYTGGGNDKISFYQSAGIAVIDGGDGYDTLVAASDYSIINISSMTSIEAVTAESVNGISHTGMGFTGGDDNFDLSGIAVSGITFIDLRAGDDIFVGSSWGERIVGGLGRDVMTGGVGPDNFDFNDVAEGDFDVITDFVNGTDRIDFANIDARVDVNDDQSFILIGTGAFTGVSGQLRYDLGAGFAMLQGDVNGDGVADFNIQVNGATTFGVGDFFL